LPSRLPEGNKGTFGKVLLICGSKNMVGCCSLATKGALRSGAGLVTLAFPDVLYTSLTSSLTENLFLPLASDEKGFISHLAIADILDAAQQADVIMLGCGIGVGYAQSLITTTLLSLEKNLVLDADALNNLVGCTALLKKSKANIIVTPHPGEMARLVGCSVE
jgi:NAD(P)H-hydrate epimerase